ncbi:HYDIN protein, partial [Cisticola juncidis]|nr:HYDIN protein [Cisticola juncidis]
FESSRCPQGDVDVLLPIKVPQLWGQAAGWAQQQMSAAPCTEFSVLLQVAKGPRYKIHLHATVMELSLNISKDTLQFSDTLVGQCQIETVRIYNWFQVPCQWSITAIKPVGKVKHRQH